MGHDFQLVASTLRQPFGRLSFASASIVPERLPATEAGVGAEADSGTDGLPVARVIGDRSCVSRSIIVDMSLPVHSEGANLLEGFSKKSTAIAYVGFWEHIT